VHVVHAQRDLAGYWWLRLEDPSRPEAHGEWVWRPGEAPELCGVVFVSAEFGWWSRFVADADLIAAIAYAPRRRIVQEAVDFWKNREIEVQEVIERWYKTWNSPSNP